MSILNKNFHRTLSIVAVISLAAADMAGNAVAGQAASPVSAVLLNVDGAGATHWTAARLSLVGPGEWISPKPEL
jgi:hypothetical protein